MEETMQIPTRLSGVLVLALLVAACGMSDPGMQSSNGGVLQGTLVAGGSQNVQVGMQSMGAAATTGAGGAFLLTEVPAGASTLQFSGGGHNAVLTMPPVVSGEFRHMSVSVSGDEASEDNEQTETEFEGTVEAISGTVLTIAGRMVAVTDATMIGKDGAAATFAELTLGTPVEVEGTLNADGTVTASEIRIEEQEKNAERAAFVGTLTQISGNTLTVGGVMVNVGPTTMIVKGDTALALADLAVGDRVLVRGAVQADKSINATRIRVLQGGGEAEEMHVTGKVTAVDATSFTIGETKITADASTEFEGSGLHSLADLKVGDFALAEVVKQTDGSLLAKEVKRFTPPSMPPVMPPMPSM
jgi:cytoskeletal protein CcmA (bactofilin family)